MNRADRRSLEEHAAETNPNLDLIDSLRSAISWLEQHPTLPEFHCHLMAGSSVEGLNRTDMIKVANALDDPTEQLNYETVVIRGRVGEVSVSARTPLSRVGVLPKPLYKPIIEPASQSLPVTPDDLAA